MTAQPTTLGDVLKSESILNPSCFLYLPMDEVWNLETRSAVLASSDVDGVPEEAQQKGLSYALEVAAVQDVVANARAQKEEVSLEELLKAFLFYYDHDAYITL